MKQARDYIVFPLDVPTVEAALPYVDALGESIGLFKVGLELFIRSGPEVIRLIQTRSQARIFLDLKLHDIPATVARAMAVVADLGVALVTVHCGESLKMLEAAVSGSRGAVGVLGVTVLTSLGPEDIRQAGFKEEFSTDVSRLVLHRAAMAKQAGCAGVVCSGLEVAAIRQAMGKDFIAVTPGIRSSGERPTGDDQRRVMTPAQAIQNGADYLVIGRPIRDAAEPAAAAEKIALEIQAALTHSVCKII